MAVAFRSAGTVAFNDTTADVVVPYPAGVAAGDLLVIQATTYPGGLTANTPAGWTKLFGPTTLSGTVNPKGYLFWKIAGGSEPSTVTVTHSGTFGGMCIAGIMVAYSGADATTPINVSATGTGSGGVAPTATTTVANTVLLRMHWHWSSSASVTPAGGTTERYDVFVSQVTVGMQVADQAQAAAGASGTSTVSFTASNFGGLAATIAVAPSTAVPSTFVPQIAII